MKNCLFRRDDVNHFEIEGCLQSMVVLVDTREQDTKRARERYSRFPCAHVHQALSYGDYAYNFVLPDGRQFMEYSDHEIEVPLSVERKMDLDELAGCFTRSRKRFEAEFKRAGNNGARIYLLVENASWEKLIAGKYRSKYNPAAFLASILAWQIRYNLQLIMCKEETTPVLIYEILKRDLKERLERGEFDMRIGETG